ncbi:CbtA family protein [Gordonia sp. ABSL1-1]|uniref:CbtA family protein n=1 Tax=Gordonia sp. ABSL1-1 TaxID=3053923 RepID=UPI002574261A|nr:CbtA family protein [Gordonia sp. ABSL1-1]MDL9937136.1 CbtA family protein [Gordonia sp. ABSL1-1]
MEKRFIGAGLFAGLIAGVFAFLFARVFTEPVVAKAIDYEEARSAAEEHLEAAGGGHSHGEGGELFTRAMQENLGAGVGTLVFTACMGAFFAVAFTLLWAYLGRRYPATDPRAVAAALGAIGFIAVFAVPFLAYPANPPAVGDDDTIGERSGAFLTITLASVIFAIVAVVAALWLRPRIGGLVAGVCSGAGYVVAVAITIALLPSFDEVPGPVVGPDGVITLSGFPGDVIGDFRVYAIATQIIAWTVLTAVFALVIGYLARRDAQAGARAAVTAA